MNPFTILPPRVRLWLYAVIGLAALMWGAYEASNGDWRQFVGGLIVALTGATAAPNVTPPDAVVEPFEGDAPDTL